jgi:hypothetical protein
MSKPEIVYKGFKVEFNGSDIKGVFTIDHDQYKGHSIEILETLKSIRLIDYGGKLVYDIKADYVVPTFEPQYNDDCNVYFRGKIVDIKELYDD